MLRRRLEPYSTTGFFRPPYTRIPKVGTKKITQLEGLEARRRALEDNTLVTIKLEDGTKTFYLSKSELCRASDYFVAALSNDKFTEGQAHALCMPGCDEFTFLLFHHWLENGKLPELKDYIPESYNEYEALQVAAVKLWAFADTSSMPRLQNETMQLFVYLCDMSYPEILVVELIYTITAERSKLRNLIAPIFVRIVEKKVYESEFWEALGKIPGWNTEFYDLMSARPDFECPTERRDLSEYEVDEGQHT